MDELKWPASNISRSNLGASCTQRLLTQHRCPISGRANLPDRRRVGAAVKTNGKYIWNEMFKKHTWVLWICAMNNFRPYSVTHVILLNNCVPGFCTRYLLIIIIEISLLHSIFKWLKVMVIMHCFRGCVTGENSSETEEPVTETRALLTAVTAGHWVSVGGLLPFSNYSIRVRACNSQGCVESASASISLPPAG